MAIVYARSKWKIFGSLLIQTQGTNGEMCELWDILIFQHIDDDPTSLNLMRSVGLSRCLIDFSGFIQCCHCNPYSVLQCHKQPLSTFSLFKGFLVIVGATSLWCYNQYSSYFNSDCICFERKREDVTGQEKGQNANVHLQPWDDKQFELKSPNWKLWAYIHWRKLHRQGRKLYRRRGILPSNQSWMLCGLRRRGNDKHHQ